MRIVAEEVARLEGGFGWSSPLTRSTPDGPYSLGATDSSSAYDGEQMEVLDSGEGGWWYVTRNRVLQSVLHDFPTDGVLWDVGSGSGIVTKFILDQVGEAIGIEPNLHGAQLCARRGAPSIHGVLQDLKLPDNSLAGLGMFDVLEHLEDREGMLKEIYRVLKPGGRLYLTLPALQSLWSTYDEIDGHQLRYDRKAAREEVESAGFRIEYNRFFFLISLPVLFLVRVVPYRLGRRPIISKEKMVSGTGGALGKLVTLFELWWSKVGLIGTSLLVVARKP